MKYQYIKLFFALILIFCQPLAAKQKTYQSNHAIIFNPRPGRLGDQIIGYSATKWLSHKYKIPFLLNVFVPKHPELTNQFKQLNMFNSEKHANPKLIEELQKTEYPQKVDSYLRTVVIKKESDLVTALNESNIPTLFICSLGTNLNLTYKKNFKEWIDEYLCDKALQTYLVSLEKPFKLELKRLLKPVISNPIQIPHNQITVAVHIRTGEGKDYHRKFQQYFDNNNYSIKYNIIHINGKMKKITTLGKMERIPQMSNRIKKSDIRFLPKQYYVDQIIKLSELLKNTPMFVYIFTDAKDRIGLINEIKDKVNLTNITWGYEPLNGIKNPSIIEDFDAMAQFDCLIRSHSNFSIAASLLGNHKIIITPTNARWVDKEILLIDDISIIVHNNFF